MTGNAPVGSSWRRYWPVDLLAVVFLVVVVLLGTYLTHRQQVSDRRAENQRRAICAILATIPGHVPPEIRDARRVFARPHHPDDCQPRRHPTARSTPSNSEAGPRPPSPTFVVIRPEPPPQVSASPPRKHTASPRPSPSRSPKPSHSPSPSPSPSCSVHVDVAGHSACIHGPSPRGPP